MSRRLILAAAAGLLVPLTLLLASQAQVVSHAGVEYENLPESQLAAEATEIIVGDLQRIYLRSEQEDGNISMFAIAQVLVEEVLKGEAATPGKVVYLSFWIRSPSAMQRNPALDPGYSISTMAKGKVKCFFTVAEDGALPVIKPNGITAWAEPIDVRD